MNMRLWLNVFLFSLYRIFYGAVIGSSVRLWQFAVFIIPLLLHKYKILPISTTKL